MFAYCSLTSGTVIDIHDASKRWFRLTQSTIRIPHLRERVMRTWSAVIQECVWVKSITHVIFKTFYFKVPRRRMKKWRRVSPFQPPIGRTAFQPFKAPFGLFPRSFSKGEKLDNWLILPPSNCPSIGGCLAGKQRQRRTVIKRNIRRERKKEKNVTKTIAQTERTTVIVFHLHFLSHTERRMLLLLLPLLPLLPLGVYSFLFSLSAILSSLCFWE